ncbi:MAG TPA: hypothetical protein VG672_03025, partial [Bryobacteraceae bacterium]|nr:hypothetical protein [Bryobacteraceae bacterium]
MKLALRRLLKNPGFTAVSILTLALGIGLCTGMCAVGMLFMQPSPAPASDELVSLFRTSPQSRTQVSSPGDYFDFKKSNTSFQQVSAYYNDSFNLAQPGQPAERLLGISASADFFSVFGIAP